jgi:hypothetical protein
VKKKPSFNFGITPRLKSKKSKPIVNPFKIKKPFLSPAYKRTQPERSLIKKHPWGDKDGDGVPNWIDCKPMNRMKQGKNKDIKRFFKERGLKIKPRNMSLKEYKNKIERDKKVSLDKSRKELYKSIDRLGKASAKLDKNKNMIPDSYEKDIQEIYKTGKLIKEGKVVPSRKWPKPYDEDNIGLEDFRTEPDDEHAVERFAGYKAAKAAQEEAEWEDEDEDEEEADRDKRYTYGDY